MQGHVTVLLDADMLLDVRHNESAGAEIISECKGWLLRNGSCVFTPPSPFYGADNISGGWELASYLDGHEDAIWAVDWRGHQSRVLVGVPDRTACMWLPPLSGDRTTEAVLVSCTSEGVSPRYRAHGTTALRDTFDRTGRIWESHWNSTRHPPQWKIEDRLQDRHMHSHLVTVTAFSPDGQRLMTGSRDGIARIWHAGQFAHGTGKDPVQWELLATLKAHTDIIWAVAWSPDSRYVLTGARDNFTHVWSPSQVLPYQWEVEGTLQEIKCLFTIDHAVDSVYYAGVNMTQNVTGNFSDWEKDKGLTISVVPGAWLVISGHNNQLRSCTTGGFSITCSNGVTSADPRWEALGSQEPIDELHKLGNGTGRHKPCQSRSRFYLTAHRFAKKLYATDDRYAVFRIRLATQQALGLDFYKRRVDSGGGHVGSFPGGVTADGHKEGLIGELQRQFIASPVFENEYSFRPEGEKGHFPPVWIASWSPDGQKILTGSRDGSVRVWHLVAHKPMQWRLGATLRGHTGVVWSLAWSPNGQRAVTAGHDGLVRIWRIGPEPPAPGINATYDDVFVSGVLSSNASVAYMDVSVGNLSAIGNATDLVASSVQHGNGDDSNASRNASFQNGSSLSSSEMPSESVHDAQANSTDGAEANQTGQNASMNGSVS